MLKRENTFLSGDKILLRPLTPDDVDGNYRYWLNDQEVVRFNSHGRFVQTPETLRAFVVSTEKSDKNLVLAVIDKINQRHIGNISLQNINWIDRNAEIAFLLGEIEYSGKGIMNEAGHLLITHAFSALNLHRVYCGTSADNVAMHKLAQKLGMIEEGRRLEAIFKDGKYVDIIEYGIVNK